MQMLQTAATASLSSETQFEELIVPHIPSLKRFARRMCKHDETAEDLVQETLLRAWRYVGRVRDPAAAQGWLFRIFRNERYRAISKAPPFSADVEPDTLPSEATEPDLDTHRIRKYVDELPQKYALPLRLFAFDDYDVREIATMLETNRATVRTRLFRGRARLRAAITGETCSE